MAQYRTSLPTQVNQLAEDEVEIIISTGNIARDGHILVPGGADLASYRANPVILWQHDADVPVGNAADVQVAGNTIVARVKFAPLGVSADADRVRGLVKSGVIRTTSVGFNPLEGEPIDLAKPRGGQRFTKWEIMEVSFVSVPADTGAVVTARAASEADWKVGAARNLAVEDSDDWDGPAAQDSLFEHAGGDDFSPAIVRRGFLVYDAAKPKLRASYKLPIARVLDGKMVVPKGALRAAASRLPQMDIPEDVKVDAEAVLDHYKNKAEMDQSEGDRRARPLRVRGLYECAMLAYLVDQLGYQHGNAEWETAAEGDNSPVPAMLGKALKQLGDSLIAMTSEEVAELLSAKGIGDDEDDETLPPEERAYVRAAPAGVRRGWRRGYARARIREGRVLSQGNTKHLQDANEHHAIASERIGDAKTALEKVGGAYEAAADAQGRAASIHEKLGGALKSALSEPDKAESFVRSALTRHAALGRQIDEIGVQHEALGDASGDAMDGASATVRSVARAQRCVRSVLDGAPLDDDDGTTADLPEDATDTSDRDADARRRRARAFELAPAQ